MPWWLMAQKFWGEGWEEGCVCGGGGRVLPPGQGRIWSRCRSGPSPLTAGRLSEPPTFAWEPGAIQSHPGIFQDLAKLLKTWTTPSTPPPTLRTHPPTHHPPMSLDRLWIQFWRRDRQQQRLPSPWKRVRHWHPKHPQTQKAESQSGVRPPPTTWPSCAHTFC